MHDPAELSDGEFMKWAGVRPQRWALLPSERREGWLEYLVARMVATQDPEQRRTLWRLATVIAHTNRDAAPSVDD